MVVDDEKVQSSHSQDVYQVFCNREIRAVWDDADNKWWFSVVDVVAVLPGQPDYKKARNYWKYLKIKLKTTNPQLVSATNQLKVQVPDG